METNSNTINWFEIPASDIGRAKKIMKIFSELKWS